MSTNRKKRIKAFNRRQKELNFQNKSDKLNERYNQLSELSVDERIKELQKIADQADSNFRNLIEEFREKSVLIDPLYTLALNQLNKRILTAGDEWAIPEPFLQADSEVLQALLLQKKYDDYSHPLNNFAATQTALEIGEIVRKSSREIFLIRNVQNFESLSEEEVTAEIISAQMKVQTQYIRNWGTGPQMFRYVKSIFAPLENEIQKETGLRVDHLLEMFRNIVKKTDFRIRLFGLKIQRIQNSKNLEQALSRFFEIIPESAYLKQQIIYEVTRQKIEFESYKIKLCAEAYRALPEIFTYSLKDFTNAYPSRTDLNFLEPIISRWSIKFGEIIESTHTTKSLFLQNPVKLKPLIDVGGNEYFFSGLEIFESFCLDIIQDWVESMPRLKGKYDKRAMRSKFLENQIAAEFKKYFPADNVLQGSTATEKDHGSDLESDVMVISDELLFVIEAKSHRITSSGLQGRLDRLKTKFQEIIADPSEQSERIINFLNANRGSIKFHKKGGKHQTVETDKIKQTIPVSVSLESFGEIGTNIQRLKDAGLINKNERVLPVITLSDLEVILDLLPGVCQKAHYLQKRNSLSESIDFLADEMDLLFTYLRTGFNFNYELRKLQSSEDKLTLDLRLNSRHLTQYLISEITGIKVPKPQRSLTVWWKQAIDKLEKEKPDNWLKIGCFLLDMSIAEQVNISKARLELVRDLSKESIQNDIAQSHLLEVGQNYEDMFALLVYQNLSSKELADNMLFVIKKVRENHPAKKITVMAFDARKRNEPFSNIWIIED